MRNASRRTKVRVAVALAIAIIVALVVTATTTGFSDPAVPSGDVATVDGVDNGTISQEDFDAAMKEGAQSLGLQKVPAPDDDQYAQLVGQVMQGLVLPIWVRGEAEERGITVDDDDVQDEYEAQKKQAGIKNQEDLEKILKQQNLTEEEVLDGIRDQLLQQKLLAEAAPGSQSLPDDLAQLTPEEQTEKLADHYGVSDHDVQAYYDTAKDKPVAEGGFTTPPTRTARVILNTSEDKINAAKGIAPGSYDGADGAAPMVLVDPRQFPGGHRGLFARAPRLGPSFPDRRDRLGAPIAGNGRIRLRLAGRPRGTSRSGANLASPHGSGENPRACVHRPSNPPPGVGLCSPRSSASLA